MASTQLVSMKQSLQKEIDEGKITREQAEQLIDSLPSKQDQLDLLIFLDEIAPAGVGLFEGVKGIFGY